ncbi:Pleckstrin homology domain-containing protein [Lasiosphaeria miniovina]|uniref:Pleckstrin homology domain-containing protein n=1 Tax=Lasiosphaeria miniovina TaxID=1954250 RepID=A0AA40BIH4_9PEZI|nr:guanine nucleotide exchange factor [Lasiosphaeria miniovina]KAK0734832.1 Pleckstrin homology domain-containing protein [Lasiosphaeria miniovina]
MADTVKPTEVPQETVPATEPVVKAVPAEAVPAEAAPATTEPAATEVEAAPATVAEPVAATEAAAPAEETKAEELKPVEEGSLEHKGQGANFPKNIFYSKKHFWFGAEPVDVKSLATFKADKAIDVAHHVTAWAAETGKGLLFFGEKSTPHGAIQLAEASEPATEGANKFHFTSKGHKHTFKASSATERDSWVAQLKAKIAEAKELAATIPESETYKKTLESLKPAKKEEKAPSAEPVAEAPAATEEVVAEAPAVEAPKEEAVEAPAAEAPKEEVKKEEPKRRSASRKRNSIFGSLPFGKKEEKKAAEAVAAEPAKEAETAALAVEAPAVVEAPAAEVVVPDVVAETAPATEEAAPAETKVDEKKEEVAEAKPTPSKRGSIFSNLSFGKKKVATPEAAPVEETPVTAEAVAETAPVIPAVDTSEPLSAEVSSPATVPTETVEAAPATNGETKKEVKSDKRKSSLPFTFGKKEKVVSSDEETEKPKSPSAFSKLRATIKSKAKAEKVEKTEEKAEETPAAAEAETTAAEPATEEAPKPAELAEEPVAKPLESTPVVAATA